MLEGTTVGAYRIVRQLGEGGMGTVYLGEHALLGRRVAIKVLLPALSMHEEFVQRFFNEAKVVTQIADPGIVQVFDFGHHTDGSAYIIMELLEGEALDRRIERLGRIAPLDCLRLMRQICTSLAAAHAKSIIHRDLKPENIYIVGDVAVTGAERTKILDFGIAKLLDTSVPSKHKTRTGMVMGTPVYMSPEQCRGAGEIDARSDIYAIGCVLMTMLTGQPPFEAEGAGDLIIAHVCQQPPRASARVFGLPDLFDEILERCLAKAPADRYQSMLELAHVLGHAEQQVMRSSEVTVFGDAPAYVDDDDYDDYEVPTVYAPRITPPATPTTLTRAVGEPTAAAPAKRSGLTIALVAAALTIAGVFTFGMYRRAEPVAPAARVIAIDAARVAPADASVDAPADASIDAPVDAPPPIDAAPIVHRYRPAPRPAPAPPDAEPEPSPEPATVDDRGD